MMPFGYLSRAETEMLILRVAYLRGSAYEADQHRALAARAGVSSVDIDAIFRPDHGFTGRIGTLLDAAEQIVRHQGLSEDMAKRVRAFFLNVSRSHLSCWCVTTMGSLLRWT